MLIYNLSNKRNKFAVDQTIFWTTIFMFQNISKNRTYLILQSTFVYSNFLCSYLCCFIVLPFSYKHLMLYWYVRTFINNWVQFLFPDYNRANHFKSNNHIPCCNGYHPLHKHQKLSDYQTQDQTNNFLSTDISGGILKLLCRFVCTNSVP